MNAPNECVTTGNTAFAGVTRDTTWSASTPVVLESNGYLSEQGEGVVLDKGIIALLIHCVCAQLLQCESTCKWNSWVAGIILIAHTGSAHT